MAELERLGETGEWGSLMIRLLELAGWKVRDRPMLGGVMLIATGFGISVLAAGDCYAQASCALFQRVMALKRWQSRIAA